jgi:AhpD family alkylhydroperoxidase
MHIDPRENSAYPFFIRPFFYNQKRKYGQELLPGKIWGRVPKLFAAVAILYGVLDRKKSPLDPVLRSLVTVRVSQINHCEFCVDINSMTLANRAGSADKVNNLKDWQQQDIYTEKEKAVLLYTEEVTYSDREVSPSTMDTLKTYFSDDAIVELTGLIAFQNMSSKFNAALDIPAQGFCSLS